MSPNTTSLLPKGCFLVRLPKVADQRGSLAFGEGLSPAEIPVPRRATEGSAGYDFTCPVAVGPARTAFPVVTARATTSRPSAVCMFPTSSISEVSRRSR